MGSKLKFIIIIAALGLAACGKVKTTDADSENILGNPLQSISQLSKADGSEKKAVVMFDETIRKIHQFKLQSMAYNRAMEVLNPEQKHYLVYQDDGNYIFDISLKNISVFNSLGERTDHVLNFQGNPISAAYVSSLNLFAVYDDLSNVGLLQVDSQGQLQKSWVGGPLIADTGSISAGDFTSDGRLILALSDNSIAVVDTQATFAQKHWVYSQFSSGLTNIKWMAPVNGAANQILVKSQEGFSLYDLNSQSILSSFSITGYLVEKYSKSADAHAVLRSLTDDQLMMVYVLQGQIKTRTLVKQVDQVMSSFLNLNSDSWSYVDTKSTYAATWNDLNSVKVSRTFKKYRLSDMLGLQRKTAPDNAQLELSENFLFALFPSELGYAVRYNTESDQTAVLKLFNMPHL